MQTYKTVFTTERGARHQQIALNAAPDLLDITLLRQPDRATLLKGISDACYLISERVGVVNAELIGAATQLKLILRLGSLAHDIDTDAAGRAGIAVCYWPVGAVIRVAEHAILQMLALTKRLREAEAIALAAGDGWGERQRTDEDTFAYNWSHRHDVDGLWRKTVGIVGFGEIGTELARRLQGWGCTVLYHRRRRLPAAVEAQLAITYADMDELFAASDHLVNLLPYFPETELSIDRTRFAQMKRGAFFASCGSGSVVNEDDLAAAVASGKLGGAALDTFEWEPIRPDNPLIDLAQRGFNVLLTPHTAGGATGQSGQERIDSYSNILRHIRGEPLLFRLV